MATQSFIDELKSRGVPHRDTTIGNLVRLTHDKSLLHIICLMSPRARPGTMLFQVMLEHTHYPANTPANHLLQLVLFNWEEMDWADVMIPATDHDKAQAIADQTGMRLADGIPQVVSHGQVTMLATHRVRLPGARRFPLDTNRVWTLERREDAPPLSLEEEVRRVNEVLRRAGMPEIGRR